MIPLNKITSCGLIRIPTIADVRGNLNFIEGGVHIPFDVARVYYLSNVPEGGLRGGHAHKALEQVLISISGSFEVKLHDGLNTERVLIENPSVGLYLSNMVWRELENFTANSVCLVLASQRFDEDDYYRNFREFLEKTQSGLTDDSIP